MSGFARTARASTVKLFRAFRYRDYRLFFYSFVANQVGFWLANLAMQGVMVGLTDNDPSWVGRLFFTLFSPALFFAPIAGVVADRVDRKRMLILCYLLVAVISSVMSVMAATETLGRFSLMGLAFACGVAFSFSGPASNAIAANIIETEDLASAISLQSTANNLTRVIGPAVAAPLIAGGRYATSFAIFAVASASAALLVGFIRVPDYHRDPEVAGIWERLRSGLQHARERPPAVLALTTAAVLSVFGVAHTALLPSFAEQALGDASGYPWIFASTGVGAILGAVITGVEGRPKLRRSTLRLFLYGAALIGFAQTTNLAAALVAQATVGFFYFSVMTSIQTLLQEIVDDGKRGRVMSLFFVAWGGVFPLGALMLGELANRIGVAPAITISGGICLLFGLLFTVRLRSRGG